MQDHPLPLDLSGLAQSLYAQGTEEGILARLMERIAPVNRFCVDIGASDGLRNSNTARLLHEQDWAGVLVEGSAYRFGKLAAHYAGAERVRLYHDRVQPDTVDRLLADANTPADFDLLSIDIDGNDYWVWRGLQAFQPRIVVIEYNPYYTPPERWVMCFNPDHEWDGSTYYGASLESLVHLGRRKGYELVCCDDMGNNAFFVRQDLYPLLGIANNDPSVLFRPAMYKLRYVGHNTFLTGHPYRHGPAEHI
ncbi:FkbM family methyltransferase [Burkholderia ambifaria]|uniref:FkbM family methyltransferase n=1 Tax=Burkholderia ambifaria TaxID=152480 RepID=UPI001589C47A|nr:FkbM family methyltransferase [Burkholderia ambifaria]